MIDLYRGVLIVSAGKGVGASLARVCGRTGGARTRSRPPARSCRHTAKNWSSTAFVMGKFALRGLAKGLSRELGPQGVHVGHVVVDGAIRLPSSKDAPTSDVPDAQPDPEAIAHNGLQRLAQPRSTWTCDIELRTWVERF